MSGNSVMGNVKSDRSPNKVSMIDTTVDNTGRSINLFSMVDFFYEPDNIATMEQPLRRTLIRSVILLIAFGNPNPEEEFCLCKKLLKWSGF